jgi:hypothetical protein
LYLQSAECLTKIVISGVVLICASVLAEPL